MSQKVKIFKQNIEIDLPTFINSRGLICANSGGGKSYAVRKLIEEINSSVICIIIDIEDEFKTLREKYDFVLVGDGGDVEISMSVAGILAKKILELNISVIINVSELKNNERVQYVKKFLEGLMEAKREFWKPCLIILDEAHKLAGQQEKQESTFAVIDLMTRGRKRGFCGVLCTQRISKLHKDAVAECNNLLIGRTGLDIDMKRAAEILGFTEKSDRLSLRNLEAGEFFTFGPAISKEVLKVKVDKVNTLHPKVGMDINLKVIPPTTKIKQVLDKLNDLSVKEIKQNVKLSNVSSEVFNVNINQLKERIRVEVTKEISAPYQVELNKQNNTIKELQKRLQSIRALADVSDSPTVEVPNSKIVIQKSNSISSQNVTTRSNNDKFDLNKCERMVYSLLAQYADRSFSKSQLGVFTGYSHKSGGFNNALSRLKTLDLIKGDGQNLSVKAIYSNLVQEFDFSKQAIISKLNKCEREVYGVLLEHPTEEYSKEALAMCTPTNYSANSGGFNNALSRLSTLGLIVRNAGEIKLNPDLLEI